MISSTADAARRRRLLILAGLWLSALAVLVVFRSVLMPFAGAALIAYLIAPLVGRIHALELRGKHPPRWVAILLVYSAFFGVTYLGAVTLLPQLYRELIRISREGLNALSPESLAQFADSVDAFFATHLPEGLGDGVRIDARELFRGVGMRAMEEAQSWVGDFVGVARTVIGGIVTGVFMLFFMLMVAAFLSIDARAIGRYFATLIPPEFAQDASALVERIDRSLAGVVRGQVTICVVNGVLTFIGLLIFKVKFALLLATIATVFSLIPIFGTIISSIPIVLLGLAQGWKIGLACLLWIIGIHALEAYFLNPKIMGTAARIHPVIVAFALIAGERTFGLNGALFAVPVAALFVAGFDFARQKAQPLPPIGSLPSVSVAAQEH